MKEKELYHSFVHTRFANLMEPKSSEFDNYRDPLFGSMSGSMSTITTTCSQCEYIQK